MTSVEVATSGPCWSVSLRRRRSSNEDESAVRDPEEKETEEDEVDGEAVEGGGNEAVGGVLEVNPSI